MTCYAWCSLPRPTARQPSASARRCCAKLCTDDEVRLTIKTRRALYDAVEAEILRLHPYDCPQVLCLAVDAVSAGYQAWATAAVSANPAV